MGGWLAWVWWVAPAFADVAPAPDCGCDSSSLAVPALLIPALALATLLARRAVR
jgi:hypothetical protein